MTALRDLYLEQNLLREMPSSLTCLTTLVMMRLSANRLKSLPDVSDEIGILSFPVTVLGLSKLLISDSG